MNWFFRQ